MSLLQRITSGGDTGAYVTIITDQARKVARCGIPHPEGRRWDDDDVHELVSEYFLSPAYRNVLLSATDDDQLNALVYTALHNQVRAKLRRSERARLRRRVKELMHAEGFLEGPPKFWRRPQDADAAFGGNLTRLVEASWTVQVRLVRWRPDTRRNSPIAERASFLSVLEAIFDAAAGSVHEDDLLDVVARRFGIGPVSYTESLDVPDESEVPADREPTPEELVIAEDEVLEAAMDAVGIWGQLTAIERRLLPLLHASARDAAAQLGIGKTTANVAQARLKEKMRVMLDGLDPERHEDLLRELGHLAAGSDS